MRGRRISPECSVKHVQTKKIRKENTRSYLVQKLRGTFAGWVTVTFHLLAMWLSRGRGRSDREANDAASNLASAKHRYFTGDSSSRDTRHTDPSARRNARNAETDSTDSHIPNHTTTHAGVQEPSVRFEIHFTPQHVAPRVPIQDHAALIGGLAVCAKPYWARCGVGVKADLVKVHLPYTCSGEPRAHAPSARL